MTPAQLTGSTFRGGLLRGAIAGAVALLVVYGALFLTSDEPAATAQAACEQGAAVPSPSDNPGLVSDCAVLLAAKDALRGTDPLNWSADRAITSWEGITVSGSPGRVTRLVLDRNTSPRQYGRRITLTGTIPAALGGLSQMERLTLTRHELTGPIPAELGNLSELTDLQLYGNQLTGAISPELGNLTRLSLRSNQLTGGIPVELGSLSNLDTLSLERNRFTGGIPASLGDLPSLYSLKLSGNTMLTGCIPASLRGITLNDLGSLGLDYCTTTTTHSLTTSAEGNGRVDPLPGTYSFLSDASVTVTATPDAGHRISSWGDDCSASGAATTCVLTMDTDRTASVTFERITYTLTVTAGEGGSVTPEGTTTHGEDAEVTVTASWNDATHSFAWSGDCEGTASTCVLTMDAAKTVTATFAALPATRCATTTATDCIRAVYLGAPGDYAQVSDIPAEVLLTPAADGRYYVERGQQYTVVTAAPLPAGWTRFYLQRTPLGDPRVVSHEQLIPPVGTTYTFTVTEDEAAFTLITFDLTAARPFPRPRPDGKPELGDTVVSTVFSVETDTLSYNTYDTTGAVDMPGSHAFLTDASSLASATDSKAGLRSAKAILVNIADSNGASQATLYSSMEPGDVVEWFPAGNPECWERYKVTEILPDPPGDTPRKLLAVERLYVFLNECPERDVADIIGEEDPRLELRWNPPAGRPGCDGIPVMLKDQPVPGGASYRAAPHTFLVIDIPEDMTVVRLTGFVLASVQPLRLEDVASGSLLLMNLETGEEWKRTIVTSEGDSRDIGTLFDSIVSSARTVVESCSK